MITKPVSTPRREIIAIVLDASRTLRAELNSQEWYKRMIDAATAIWLDRDENLILYPATISRSHHRHIEVLAWYTEASPLKLLIAGEDLRSHTRHFS